MGRKIRIVLLSVTAVAAVFSFASMLATRPGSDSTVLDAARARQSEPLLSVAEPLETDIDAITAEETRGKLTLFAGMDRVRFKAPVRPGDTVEFVCEELRHRGGFHVVRAEGRVEGKVCLCGEFTFFLADPKEMK